MVNSSSNPPMAWKLVGGLAIFKLLTHLLTVGAWGSEWFVDELYFMACAEHVDWGYVDMPPFFPFVLTVVTAVLGDGLFVVRMIAATAGAGLVVLIAALAREMGGDRWAQATAGLCVILAPIYLIMHGITTMNALDPLMWVGCALVLARILNGGDPRLWLLFGVLAGLGINNKHTFALWGLSLVIGLLATGARRHLRSKWIWLGGGVAVLFFIPNIVWMVENGFPHLEQLANIRANQRDVSLSPFAFLGQQVLMLNPPSAILWLSGLVWFIVDPGARRYRPLGVAWLTFIAAMILLKGRPYYPAAAHPVVLAAGAVALERFSSIGGWRSWVRPVVPAVMALMGVVIAPLTLWVLTPDVYVRYTTTLGFDQPRIENHELGPLPQLFADRYGWRELAAEVARVYHSLSDGDRAKASIFAWGYGQAGAVDRYREEFELPRAISGHLTYFLWGPGDATGEVMIVIGDEREDLEEIFETVEVAGRIHHPYSMPYNHVPVHLCRGLKTTVEELWPRTKNYS